MPRLEQHARAAIDYSRHFIGRPYLWGGDDPMAGFDCSGLINEIRWAVGIGPKEDLTADGLFRHFADKEKKNVLEFMDADPYRVSHLFHPGCLLFAGTAEKKTHVEMLINTWQTIGASGGGSATKTLDDAIRQNAYVKIRPVKGRNFNWMIDIFG